MMLVGQQLGPFQIDKELGAGAMGAVYRGRYTKTGQVVAIKVMAPGLGESNENAVARFEREAAILKQFNHPNIVRLFGHGKHKGTRYFAMEYIQGESLDRVLSRRGRFTWEEVVALGQQLCAALQHAHEQGVVHRDLKPSNLMVLPDGTVKLTDFGIAKDLDVTGLTGANCTVGTASYMSPEQCKGEQHLTHKSDLYSLGVLFYELLTGRKPFKAENVMEMFMLHVQGTFERPSRLVLDIPVWLDTLVCQLLEKKPELRPRDAATVVAALGSIQEKVEAQQSAGVDAVRSRFIDRTPGQRSPDETDKDAARTLMTGKGRARRRRKKVPFYEKLWFQAVGITALLLALVLTLYFVFRPASAEALYAEAKQLWETKDATKQEKARNGPIKDYLAHYGDRDDATTEQIRQWRDEYDVREFDEKLQKYLDRKGKNLPFPPQDETEEKAFKATDAEDDGDLGKARERWKEVREQEGRKRWGLLAERRLAALDAVDAREQALLSQLDLNVVRLGREPKLEGLDRLAFVALRYEHFGDPFEHTGDIPAAVQRFKELKKEAREPNQRLWYLLAAKKLKELSSKFELPEDKSVEAMHKERVKLVSEALKQANNEATKVVDARTIFLNVLALYGPGSVFEKDDDLQKLVAEAAKGMEQLSASGAVPRK